MSEFDVGELVEVADGAGKREACRDGESPLATRAVRVLEPGFVRVPRPIVDEGERPRVHGRQLVAGGAAQPFGERRSGHADLLCGVPLGVLVGALQPRRRTELGDLDLGAAVTAEFAIDRRAQPRFVDEVVGSRHGRVVPRLQALDQNGEVRQVDQRADAAGEHQVAGPGRAHPAEVATHSGAFPFVPGRLAPFGVLMVPSSSPSTGQS